MRDLTAMTHAALAALADRLPCKVIKGDDGTPYLERYYLGPCHPEPDGGAGRMYLHRFVGSDPDRGLHDHPWDYASSQILTGRYEEQRGGADQPTASPARLLRVHGGFYHLNRWTWHRVVLIDDPVTHPVWTLFTHGPYRHPWGFHRGGVYTEAAPGPGARATDDIDWPATAPLGAEHEERLRP